MPEKTSTLLFVGAPEGPDASLLEALANESVESVFASAENALQALDESGAELLVIAAASGRPPALELLRAALERWPGLPVLLVADELSAAQISEAVALGASELLVRPLGPKQFQLAVRKALVEVERSALGPPPPRGGSGMVFGRSPAMLAVRELVEQVAPTHSTLLLRGESGTGKELVARAVHRQSLRARGPFIKIDCTSLPENLIESELFGYEKGAFTGAVSQKLGRVELADTGTLFLDEIGELAAGPQAKLLRLLQDREFERLGGKQTRRVNVRVVAATHRDLETMVERGTFRQDLFYRLNVVPVWLPPLRARRADVAELATHFCAEVAAGIGKPELQIEAEALRLLSNQRWPGNVRQLQNFVERLVVMCRGTSLGEAEVRAELERPVQFATETGTVGADRASAPAASTGPLRLDEVVQRAERQALVRALEQAGGNRSAAARLLGVCRATLYSKLSEHGLLGATAAPDERGNS